MKKFGRNPWRHFQKQPCRNFWKINWSFFWMPGRTSKDFPEGIPEEISEFPKEPRMNLWRNLWRNGETIYARKTICQTERVLEEITKTGSKQIMKKISKIFRKNTWQNLWIIFRKSGNFYWIFFRDFSGNLFYDSSRISSAAERILGDIFENFFFWNFWKKEI